MLNIKKFVFSPFSENTYVIWDEETSDAAVIDPGCIDTLEENELDNFIQSSGLIVRYLINTHCHIDHIFGCSFVKNKYNVPYIIPELDLPLLSHAGKQGEMFGIEVETPPLPDKYLSENEPIMIGKWLLKPLFTPGHTPGEFCLYFPEAGFCITGDVLFQSSIGRTDLWGGDHPTLLNSIEKKLLVLPDDTVLYPGHGDKTTIKKEKENNPFLP